MRLGVYDHPWAISTATFQLPFLAQEDDVEVVQKNIADVNSELESLNVRRLTKAKRSKS